MFSSTVFFVDFEQVNVSRVIKMLFYVSFLCLRNNKIHEFFFPCYKYIKY